MRSVRYPDESRGKWWVMLVVGMGTFMGTLNASIVNISLPTISNYFQVKLSVVAWVMMAYLLTTSSLLITLGRMADIIGRKLIYTSGFLVFTCGTILCSVSGGIYQLIIFRVIQATGGAMMVANSAALITETFPDTERGKALGLIGGIVAIGLTCGSPMGGFILEKLSWRWIFYLNIPLGIVGLDLAILILKKRPVLLLSQKFDFKGAFFLVCGLIFLLLGLNHWQNIGWRSPSTHWLFAGFLFFGTLFLVTETKSKNPIIQLSFFRHRIFGIGNLNVFLAYLSHLSVIFLMPFYLIRVLELSPSQMGWILITVPLCLSVIAPVSGWLSDKIGTRFLTTAGLVLIGISILSLLQLDVNSNYKDVVFRLIALGLGAGMFYSPNNSSIMGSVSQENYGRAAGVLATMRNLGMVMGVSITSVIFTSSENYYLSQLQNQITESTLMSKMAFTRAFHNVYIVTGIICLVGAFLSYLRGESKVRYPAMLED